jgi:hypothetical protein
MSGIYPPLRKGSSDRQARINKLRSMLQNKGDKTTEQILGKFCFEESISVRMAREYLKILELAGVIKDE